MILKLAYYGDSILRKKGARIEVITDDIRKLVVDMEETMYANNGIGLAAQQVHKDLALFIISIGKEGPDKTWINGPLKVFINPKILEYSTETSVLSEGCLSIPNTELNIVRPRWVKIEATDLNGNTFIEEFSDLAAHCILHENDHINGVLHIDRYKAKDKTKLNNHLRKIKKEYSGKYKD